MLLCFCGHLAVVYIYRIKCFYFLQRPLYKSFLEQNIYKKPELDSWRSILASMALALLATLFKGEKGAALSANKQSNQITSRRNKHFMIRSRTQGCDMIIVLFCFAQSPQNEQIHQKPKSPFDFGGTYPSKDIDADITNYDSNRFSNHEEGFPLKCRA